LFTSLIIKCIHFKFDHYIFYFFYVLLPSEICIILTLFEYQTRFSEEENQSPKPRVEKL